MARGNIAYDQVRDAHRQGNGGKFQMFNGSPAATAGVLLYDANGDALSLALPGDGSKYLDGTGAFTKPGGSSAAGLTLLEQHTASSSPSLDFTSWFSSTYDEYLIELVGLRTDTNNVSIIMRMSTDGGSTFDSGNHYRWGTWGWTAASLTGPSSATPGSSINICFRTDNTANWNINATVRLFNPGGSGYKQILSQSVIFSNPNGTLEGLVVGGAYEITTAVNAFQFLPDSGKWASGTIRCYGFGK